MAKKEVIKPPSKADVSAASKALRQGSPIGGRVMADKSVAVRQGVAKPTKRK